MVQNSEFSEVEFSIVYFILRKAQQKIVMEHNNVTTAE